MAALACFPLPPCLAYFTTPLPSMPTTPLLTRHTSLHLGHQSIQAVRRALRVAATGNCAHLELLSLEGLTLPGLPDEDTCMCVPGCLPALWALNLCDVGLRQARSPSQRWCLDPSSNLTSSPVVQTLVQVLSFRTALHTLNLWDTLRLLTRDHGILESLANAAQ